MIIAVMCVSGVIVSVTRIALIPVSMKKRTITSGRTASIEALHS